MVFLKGDTPAHHLFAVSANAHANLNHVAYETRGLDEYMRAAGHMVRAGHEMVWGPGRHGPGSNTFAYFQDPNGFVAEYTTALEPIPDVATWQPRLWLRIPEQSDVWGTACVRNPAAVRRHARPGPVDPAAGLTPARPNHPSRRVPGEARPPTCSSTARGSPARAASRCTTRPPAR